MATANDILARRWRRKPVMPSRPVAGATLSGTIRAVGSTDRGLVRQNNEDTFRCEAGLYVVCDGMGGMAAGEVASQTAADTLVREFLRPRSGAAVQTQERLAQAIAAANRDVLLSAREPGRGGMGTTLVAAALDGEHDGQIVVANVGDSRAYLRHGDTCRQLTQDHSYANEVQRLFGAAPDTIPMADRLRFGGLITRAIGAGADVQPDFFTVAFGPGDVLLLASDGLTRYFEDPARLCPFVDAGDLEGSCGALIDAARSAGGADNITVLLLSRVAALPY